MFLEARSIRNSITGVAFPPPLSRWLSRQAGPFICPTLPPNKLISSLSLMLALPVQAYELSVLTGTQVLLLVVSETGLVYTFTTPKLQPLVTKAEGKNLIQVRELSSHRTRCVELVRMTPQTTRTSLGPPCPLLAPLDTFKVFSQIARTIFHEQGWTVRITSWQGATTADGKAACWHGLSKPVEIPMLTYSIYRRV